MDDVMKNLTSLQTLLMKTNQVVSSLKQENLQFKAEIQEMKRNQTPLSGHGKHDGEPLKVR